MQISEETAKALLKCLDVFVKSTQLYNSPLTHDEINLIVDFKGDMRVPVSHEDAQPQTGSSRAVDFEKNTWTFQMPAGFNAGAGEYMIVRVETK